MHRALLAASVVLPLSAPPVEAIWFAMLGPAGLPAEIVKKLNAETLAILAEP